MKQLTPFQIQHLYWRAGFGIAPAESIKLAALPLNEIAEKLVTADVPEYIDVLEKGLITKNKLKPADDCQPEKQQQVHSTSENLNNTWLLQMITTKNVGVEKMTLFWHSHFACRDTNSYFLQELNNIHRQYAFAPFKQLLMAVAKSPAMLRFLNNQQNKKLHPNENFARELMELFTIGHGNYTEKDIKESARAFTGWTFDKDSLEFSFNEKWHDAGEKTFFGKTGNFNGEDIIDIILENKTTAQFLCRKFYKYYVNEIPDEQHITELADYYYANNYDTKLLFKKIITCDWFYDEKNIGKIIKSPIAFIVGLSRTFHITYNYQSMLIRIQRSLGQVLFYPPTVAGWAGGRNWIDSSTIMLRMKLPSLIINGGVIDWDVENDNPDDVMMMEKNEKKQERVKVRYNATVNWDAVFVQLSQKATRTELVNALLQCGLQKKKEEKLDTLTAENKRNVLLQIVSLPEYQLC